MDCRAPVATSDETRATEPKVGDGATLDQDDDTGSACA